MRSLKRARNRARICRAKIWTSREQLLERVEEYLLRVHRIELIPVESEFLKGGRAEVVPAEGCIFYDKRFDRDPSEKLVVILHELGHLELHPRLKRRCSASDPMTGSMYLNDGGPAMARYNKRSREEADANAFATEFLCPSDEIFELWLKDSEGNSKTLAERLGVPIYVVQAQLAEALYRMALGDSSSTGENKSQEFECDESQEQAATFTGAPVLVNAGPGTGKTATLVRRIEYLITELDAAPENILVLTFSTDAAEELTERIERRFGTNIADEITISTFHGFGVSFLHHHGQFRDVDANAYILDEAGQIELVTKILGTARCEKLLNIKRLHDTVEEIVRHINFLKDRLRSPETLAGELDKLRQAGDRQESFELTQEFLEVFRAYEKAKKDNKRLDFADLIALPIDILEREKDVREGKRQLHKWVLVDEYQDVSRSVASLLKFLCGSDNPPWVVADARQSIYQFRGAARENVDDFEKDFPGARQFELNVNYRSSAEVVRVANQLATLMEAPDRETAEYDERWTAAPSNKSPFNSNSIAVAIADSDQSEHEGIATQVQSWIDSGIPLRDIVVLARRNIDVRNIVLALGKREVQATTNGLVTADGAAGDLANITTFADRSQTSLLRLAFSLGRGRFQKEVINGVVERILETLETDGSFAATGYGEGDTLAVEVAKAGECLRGGKFNADAFTQMCNFLFDGSCYLRRTLAEPESAERALVLSEIVASLSRAAVYRFTHQDATPTVSRKGFGEHFRNALSSSVPCLMPPRSNVDAVRVMTCHASKGLEFPCVIVAGQTLSRAKKGYKWLPATMQPRTDEDTDQANSLMFVGATRAQKALRVTYSTTATGTPRSQKREVSPLLGRWHTIHDVQVTSLPSIPAEREQAIMENVWGGALDGSLAARTLDIKACSINTYLRDFLGAYFPLNEKPLYPIFHAVVRHAMHLVVERAHETGRQVGASEARDIFLERWNASDVADHPHYAIYLRVALAYMERFANAYIPPAGEIEPLDPTIFEEETGIPLRLDLIAHYRKSDGERIAILFRPESLASGNRENGLLWGTLDSDQRVAFVLLRLRDPQVRPFVFSGDDGVLYPYQWGRDRDFLNESTRVLARFKEFGENAFIEQVNAFKCDQCDSRIICPHWLEALGAE